MKELKFNIKCLFLKKEFYLFILFLLLLVLINVIVSFQKVTNLTYFKEMIPSPEYVIIFGGSGFWIQAICLLGIPIFGSLAFSDLNWVEEKNRIDYFLISRIKLRNNRIIRLFLIVLMSFLLIFLTLLLDYMCLKFLLGNNGKMPYFLSQNPAFLFDTSSTVIFSELSYTHPNLYVMFISAYVSFLFSLMIALSYSFSSFMRQKILLYFMGPLLLLVLDLFCSVFNIPYFSLLAHLQLTKMPLVYRIIMIFILLFANLIGIYLSLRKRDLTE